MPIPVKNICGPSSVYGGFQQTLFLGCSVMSFTASQGWNEQMAELTVQLVEDTCTAPPGYPKLYYDTSLTPQTTTNADPGFFGLNYNITGSPVFFRVGNFEFSGLIQGWERTYSQGSNPSYSVRIVDPRQILAGTQVIINEYAGSVGTIYNLINAFGFAESTASGSCPPMYQITPGVYVLGNGAPDGSVFGSPAGKYGGANVNANGMQWNQILLSTQVLLSAWPAHSSVFSPYGRVVFKGTNPYPSSGMGIIIPDTDAISYYFVDLEEVPIAPSYWRMNGTSVSLLDAISQICQDSGHDYYVELLFVKHSGSIYKFIKIRTTDRSTQPALNAIDTFVAGGGIYRKVQSYNKGRELRNEPTSAFVIGGPKQSFYQAEQNLDPEGDGDPTPPEADDMIVPYFGVDSTTGDVILPEKDANGWWYFNAPTDDLALQLYNPKYNRVIGSTLVIHEKELLAAASGIDAWMAWAGEQNTELWQALSVDSGGANDIAHLIDMVKNVPLAGNAFRPADWIAMRPNIFQPQNDTDFDLEVIQIGFAWIEKFVKDFYGKRYQVRVPFTCGRLDVESGAILTSEEPTDGGWTEMATVLGLSHPSIYTDAFTLEDNRLGAFCRFDNTNGIELSGLDVNDYITLTNKAWVKIQVDPEYVYLDKSTLFSPRAVITLPEPILSIEILPDVNANFGQIINLVTEFGDNARGGIEDDVIDRVEDAWKHVGSKTMHLSLVQRALMPSAAGFGIKSNILKYGPWGAAGVSGPVAPVIDDEGLVPWEYGGFTTLDLAGNSLATAGVTNYQIAEEGSVTVVGYPELPLGAELLAADSGGPYYGGGYNLIENRILSSGAALGSTYYYTPMYAWSGTYGPTVTNITVQVSAEGGATTQYNLRTWTPKFGIFSKGNAERIKQIGRQRLLMQKQIRAWSLQRAQKQQLNLIHKLAGDRPGVKIGESIFAQPKTPHEVLVGEIIQWNDGDYKRPLVSTNSTLELPIEMANNFDSKAFMSLDGLVRPVSVGGDGSLPRYAIPLNDMCQHSNSKGIVGPVDKPTQVGQLKQFNINHAQQYLNPFANPNSALVTDLSDTPDHGHDIEIIGRDSTPPASSMVMPIQGYIDSNDTEDSDYAADYRMLALRGPLLLHSWGYDLDGFPIPNKADSIINARQGIFVDGSDLQCKFLDNWLRQSDTWPVAPVDLRFDRDRGVWSVPQYRPILAQISGCWDGQGNVAGILPYTTAYDCSGNPFTPAVVLHNDLGSDCLASGDFVVAEFDPYLCKYRVLNHIQKHYAYNICCTGNLSSYASGGWSWRHLIGRSGIRVAPTTVGWSHDNPNCPGDASCNQGLILDSTIRIANHTTCFPPSGYPKVTAGKLISFETLAFGAGLWVTAATSSGAAGKPAGAAGVQTGDCPDYSDLQCMYHVQAGLRPLNNSGSLNINTPLTSDGSRYVNVLDFQRGFRAVDGPNECDLLISAGIEPYQSTGCVTGIPALDDTKRHKNRFYFKDGLKVQDHVSDSGALDLGAGVFFSKDNICHSGSPTVTRIKNKIALGAGLWATDSADDCTIGIGAGLQIASKSDCVIGSVSGGPITKITAGKGIALKDIGSCEAELGLYFDVDGRKTAEITLGSCLKSTSGGTCITELDFKEKYGSGTSAVTQNVISGITVQCCSNGSGVKSVSYTTQTLHFNSCGQLVNVTSGSSGSGVCSC